MKSLSLIALAALLIPGFLWSQINQKPVPQSWVVDGKLNVPEFSLSIKSPAPGSRWTYATLPETDGYVFTMFMGEVGDGSN